MKPVPAPLPPEEHAHLLAAGPRIRALRRRRNLAQAEFARRTALPAATLHAIETGRLIPPTTDLLRIARVLKVSLDVLLDFNPQSGYIGEHPSLPPPRAIESSAGLTGRPDTAKPSAPLVRLDYKKQPYPPAVLALLDAAVNAFLTLEDLCGAPKHASIPLQLAMPLAERGVEELARKVRILLGIGSGIIFDYIELLENAGLRVLFVPFPDEVAGAACYDVESRNAFLFVTDSPRVSAERKLFQLLRELGRIYCHTSRMGAIPGRRRALDPEHVAAKFAALFLMPAEAVIETVRQIGVSQDRWSWDLLLRLKNRFGVSAEAFLYRLSELDLIGPAAARALRDRLLDHYEKTGRAEPGASRRRLTPNGRLGDLLLAARSSTLYPPEEVQAELQAVRDTLDRLHVKLP